MNVLHIVLALNVGGLERFVLDLAKIHSSSINPVIVCLDSKGVLGEMHHPCGIIQLNKKSGFDLSAILRLARIVKKHDIDIIHTHNPAPHVYGTLLSVLCRKPLIHTRHGRNYPHSKKRIRLNWLCSLFTYRLVAVSSDAAEVSRKIDKVSPRKLAVILNGIDTAQYFNPLGGRKEETDRPVRIGIVARLSPEKNHLALIKACRILQGQAIPFQLVIVGDGPLRQSLESEVAKLGLERQVSFLGVRHDIADILKTFDIFALSSHTEGISLTLLEAMASGLPTVATRVGGNSEVVEDGKTGFLVPPDSPEDLADKLKSLIDDKGLRMRMGLEGQRRVNQNFSILAAAEEYLALYKSALRSPGWRSAKLSHR